MKKMIGLALISCFALVGCTTQSETDECMGTAKPDSSPVDIRSTALETHPKSVEKSVAEVVSVADSGVHYLLYIVEFKITQGPSVSQTVRCLIDGYGDQAKALGKGENWWWNFVYKKSEYKSDKSFEIIYRPSDQRFHKRFEAMELISLRSVEKDISQQDAPADADKPRR